MATLAGQKIKDKYGNLLHVEGGVTATLKTVEDGGGNNTALKLSTDTVEIDGTLSFASSPTVSSTELTALLLDSNGDVVSRELGAGAFGDGSGGVSTLSGLTDTTITSPSNGDLLFYNGSAWVNDSTPRTVGFVDSSNAVNFATPNSNGNILFEAGSNMAITYSGNTVSFASTASGSSQVFANPMFVLRPNGLYSVTTTLATPPQAGINNNGNASSHEVNDTSNHFFPSSTTTGAVNVQQEGLVKIDINFMLEVSVNNTDVDVAIYEKPDGGSETLIQSIARGHSSTGNTAIGFSLVRHVAAATDLYYKISSNNVSGLLATSTFILTKLD